MVKFILKVILLLILYIQIAIIIMSLNHLIIYKSISAYCIYVIKEGIIIMPVLTVMLLVLLNNLNTKIKSIKKH